MKYILLNFIKPDPEQPRQVFDPVKMESLKQSIKEKGILTPLIVEKISENNYLVIDGERRYRTAKKLNLREIPVEITETMTSQERMIMRFHLQEQHQSWTPFDKARAIYFFMKSESLSTVQIASLLGMSHDTVSNWVGILSLSKRTQIKSIERRIPFTYLIKIAKVSQKYKEITDMSLSEIEDKLLEKIEKGAIYKHIELSNLVRFLNIEGNEDKKLEFLNNANYTVKNLLGNTPEGKSIEIDNVIYKCQFLIRKIRELKKKNYDKILNEKQSLVFKELENLIRDFRN